jgi:hom_end-associated hint
VNIQDLNTEIVRFGDLQPGDKVFTPDGTPVMIETFDAHMPERMFEIEFDDGTVLNVSGNHLWYVEHDADVQDFSRRRRLSRRVLRKVLSEDTVAALEVLAGEPQENVMSLADFLDLLTVSPSDQLVSVVARIAESVGVVEEHTFTMRDFETEADGGSTMIEMYSSARLAQQTLLLYNRRKYQPEYGIIYKGKVVKTTQLVHMYDMVSIPDPANLPGWQKGR